MSLIVIEGSNGSGKTEIVNRMTKKYDIIDKKSIPDWYRSEIEFARKCPFDIQKEIYLYGHKANYLECDKEQNYIFDRYAVHCMCGNNKVSIIKNQVYYIIPIDQQIPNEI